MLRHLFFMYMYMLHFIKKNSKFSTAAKYTELSAIKFSLITPLILNLPLVTSTYLANWYAYADLFDVAIKDYINYVLMDASTINVAE